MSLELATFLSDHLQLLLVCSVGEADGNRLSILAYAFAIELIDDLFALFRGLETRSASISLCMAWSEGSHLPSKANATGKSVRITENLRRQASVLREDGHQRLFFLVPESSDRLRNHSHAR